MKNARLLLVLLVGCSSSSNSSAPQASLQVRFGSEAPLDLSGDVVESSTSSRLLLQATNDRATVFASLALPLPQGQVAVTEAADRVSVWAKQASGTPLIAVAGGLVVEQSAGLVTISFDNVTKPNDGMGVALVIAGSMDQVNVSQ